MAEDLYHLCEEFKWSPKSLPDGEFILIKDNVETEAHFLVQHFLSLYLKGGHKVCLVCLKREPEFYANVGKKWGVSLDKYVDTQKLKVIDGQSSADALAHLSVSCKSLSGLQLQSTGAEGHTQSSFSPSQSSSFHFPHYGNASEKKHSLKRLYREIALFCSGREANEVTNEGVEGLGHKQTAKTTTNAERAVDTTKSPEFVLDDRDKQSDSFVVIFDDISVLRSSLTPSALVEFLRNCKAMVQTGFVDTKKQTKAEAKGCLVVVDHEDSFEDGIGEEVEEEEEEEQAAAEEGVRQQQRQQQQPSDILCSKKSEIGTKFHVLPGVSTKAILQNLCTILIRVEPLPSGYAKDVNGLVTIQRNRFSVRQTKSEIEFRYFLTDHSVKCLKKEMKYAK